MPDPLDVPWSSHLGKTVRIASNTAMTLPRSLKWMAGVLLAPVVLAVLFIAIFGWNWLRGPIERMTLDKTGRELAISGNLELKFGWPLPRIHAGAVTFANPGWAREKQMVSADAVEVAIDLPQLLRKKIVLPEVRLERPVIFLEQGTDGRKNWLLDLNQQDEGARIRIDRLTLDHGTLGYDDAGQKTSIRSEVSTSISQAAGAGVASPSGASGVASSPAGSPSAERRPPARAAVRAAPMTSSGAGWPVHNVNAAAPW